MRIIGVDASPLTRAAYTGTEWYTWHLIHELTKLKASEQFIWRLYIPHRSITHPLTLPPNWQLTVLTWPLKRFWLSIRLSFEMLLQKPDILFVPANALPFVCGKKTVTTIHDIGFITNPSLYSASERVYLSRALKRALAASESIITISHFSKRELERTARPNIPVTVIPLAVGRSHNEQDALSCEHEKLPYEKYIIYVGRISKKKNLEHLIASFEKVISRVPDLYCVLVGPDGYGFHSVYSRIAKSPVRNAISTLPWQKNKMLLCLLKNARALILPSWYEGFGLTVLQAQALAVPVICSDIPSLRETGGDGAYYFSLQDKNDLAKKVCDVLSSTTLQERLVRDGHKNLKRFSLEQQAQKTIDVLTSL